MAREILFRGKTRDEKEWIEGFYAVFSNTPFIGAPNRYGTMLWHPVILETVGQFTGLTDKNGKKIFEGDIVRLPELFCSEIATIEYLGSAFKAKSSSFCYQICESMVVLGNIHDNPELLNGEES